MHFERMYLMQSVKNALANKLYSVIVEKFGKEPPEPSQLAEMLEYPPDPSMGHLAFPCFKLSRDLRMGPPVIAAKIAEDFSCDYISECSVAGGYLNFRISGEDFIKHVTDGIAEKGDKYGSPETGCGKTVVLDYSSPNVAKPFHIGHLGTTVIGHALRLLHEFAGYKCVGVNHLGDWGTQFGKMIVAYRRWGDPEKVANGGCDGLVELYVKFHEEAEKDPRLNDEARAEFTKLEQGDEVNLKLWQLFLDISLKEYRITYDQLGIEFDSYMGESHYFDKAPAVAKELADKGLLVIDDGASIVNLEKYNMPPCLILKKDGSTIYPSRDIAAAFYRKNTYDFDKCIYVTSAGQSLHFAQWFKVVELMGYDWAKDLVHVPYGTVSINGEKLATRTGNVILLRDLFSTAIEKVAGIVNEKSPDLESKNEVAEAVGVGAIVFHYLANNRIRDINFNIEDALSFDGNTGPYAQYTYARCCSLLEKAGELNDNVDYSVCGAPELDLAITVSRFGERVEDALKEYEPSYITRYILDLCTAFNRMYHECKILNAEEQVRNARLKLVHAAKTVLGTALHLICMKTPNKI